MRAEQALAKLIRVYLLINLSKIVAISKSSLKIRSIRLLHTHPIYRNIKALLLFDDRLQVLRKLQSHLIAIPRRKVNYKFQYMIDVSSSCRTYSLPT